MKQWVWVLGFLVAATTWADEVVVQDGDVSITRTEWAYIVRNAPTPIRNAVIADPAERFEFIAQVLQSKRMEQAALAEGQDPNLYWEARYTALGALKELFQRRLTEGVVAPDFSEVALERYNAQKSEIAELPPRRRASHILLFCQRDCNPQEKTEELNAIMATLSDELPFEELARLHSEDLASARQQGALNTLVFENSKTIDAAFRDALFGLENVGDVSDVVLSQYGVHVIRLDEIIPATTLEFEELKPQIEAQLLEEYVKLSVRTAMDEYLPGEDILIDQEALEAVLDGL